MNARHWKALTLTATLHMAVGYAVISSIALKSSDTAGQITWASGVPVNPIRDKPMPPLLAEFTPDTALPSPTPPFIPEQSPVHNDAPQALDSTTPAVLPGALSAAYQPPPETPPIVFMPPPPAQTASAPAREASLAQPLPP